MLVHRETGRTPTPEEMEQINARALEILRNPYASPEQIEWAIDVCPPGGEIVFWQSVRASGDARTHTDRR